MPKKQRSPHTPDDDPVNVALLDAGWARARPHKNGGKPKDTWTMPRLLGTDITGGFQYQIRPHRGGYTMVETHKNFWTGGVIRTKVREELWWPDPLAAHVEAYLAGDGDVGRGCAMLCRTNLYSPGDDSWVPVEQAMGRMHRQTSERIFYNASRKAFKTLQGFRKFMYGRVDNIGYYPSNNDDSNKE